MGAPCSQQLDAIAPLFFSLHDLGEYEACQAELPALLAFDPGPRPRTSCSLAVVRRPRDQVVDSGACVYDPVLPDPLRVSAPLRRPLDAPPRGRLLVYSDAQYSQRGRKGLGVVVTDTLTHTSYMRGGEVPDDILA